MGKQVRKIYIDSCFRDAHSTSNTDFRIHLNESILMPDHTSMFVTDVCIPHCWYTIEYYNANLYFRYVTSTSSTDHVVQLPQQNYDIGSLADALVTAMNTAVGGVHFQSSIDITKGQIIITGANANVKFLHLLRQGSLHQGQWYVDRCTSLLQQPNVLQLRAEPQQ